MHGYLSGRSPTTRRLAGLAATAAVLVGSLVLGASSAAATPDPKVEICHATGSATNPYVLINVSSNSIDNREGGNGHGLHADDIIPAIDCCETPG